MDRVLIATKLNNFEPCLILAKTHGLGVEIQNFAFPPILTTSDWEEIIADHQRMLRGFPNEITLHGTFMDMSPGSPDPLFIQVTRQRTDQSLQVAQRLGATTVVFHANFIASIRSDPYRDGWVERMVQFWGPVTEYAQQLGLHVVMENMWEFDPTIITKVLEGVNSPVLTACLDVGHSQLYSKMPLHDWLDDMGEWISYIHINNNYGDGDDHLGLDDGIIDYTKVLPMLRQISGNPALVLEIEKVEDMERSLIFLDLPEIAS